jgi:hypothetical protein
LFDPRGSRGSRGPRLSTLTIAEFLSHANSFRPETPVGGASFQHHN